MLEYIGIATADRIASLMPSMIYLLNCSARSIGYEWPSAFCCCGKTAIVGKGSKLTHSTNTCTRAHVHVYVVRKDVSRFTKRTLIWARSLNQNSVGRIQRRTWKTGRYWIIKRSWYTNFYAIMIHRLLKLEMVLLRSWRTHDGMKTKIIT